MSGRAPVTSRWSLKRDSAPRLLAATSSENLSVVEHTRTLSSSSKQQPNDLPRRHTHAINLTANIQMISDYSIALSNPDR